MAAVGHAKVRFFRVFSTASTTSCLLNDNSCEATIGPLLCV